MRVSTATRWSVLPWGSAWLAVGLLALPLQAQTMADRIALDGVPSRLTLHQSQAEPLATATQGVGAPATARQTLLWVRSRHAVLGWGVGLEQRSRSAAAAGELAAPAGVLVGLSLETGPRSQLSLQTPLLHASALSPDQRLAQPARAQPLRLGLAFQTQKPYADLRRGVRVDLSGQTTLSFRPRGGRIGVSLQSRW